MVGEDSGEENLLRTSRRYRTEFSEEFFQKKRGCGSVQEDNLRENYGIRRGSVVNDVNVSFITVRNTDGL